MPSKVHDQLLNEFGGLFDGVTPEMPSFGGAESEVTQSLAQTVTRLGQAISGVTSVAPADLSAPATTTQRSKEPEGLVSGTESLARTVSQLEPMAATPPDSVAATSPGTNTRGQSATTNDTGGGPSVTSIATTFLESGFGIVPLITGLMSLFSGGSTAPPPLEKYTMPSSVSFESAETAGGLTAADFDQTGAARLYGYSASSTATADPGDAGSSTGTPPSSAATATPQITVNVQAMDAQSFMDYSSQIAQAVRGAMLNLSSLNDVVNEL